MCETDGGRWHIYIYMCMWVASFSRFHNALKAQLCGGNTKMGYVDAVEEMRCCIQCTMRGALNRPSTDFLRFQRYKKSCGALDTIQFQKSPSWKWWSALYFLCFCSPFSCHGRLVKQDKFIVSTKIFVFFVKTDLWANQR